MQLFSHHFLLRGRFRDIIVSIQQSKLQPMKSGQVRKHAREDLEMFFCALNESAWPVEVGDQAHLLVLFVRL
jgi:hypothetical protein